MGTLACTLSFYPKPNLSIMLKSNATHQFPVAFVLNMC